MKRKRGPAPHTKKRRVKSDEHEDSMEQGNSDEELDALQEDDSFKGFSSDDDEENQLGPHVNNDESSTILLKGASSSKEKRAKKSAPTQEELMELLFRSSSFQSNLFKLQVDELLSEVRIKYEKMEKLETILHKLKDILMQLPESQEQLLNSFEIEMRNSHHIRVPFPKPPPPKDALYKFKFQRPVSVKLVGAYGLKAAAKHPNGFTVDVSVTMPDTVFQEKDYLDHRYFYKRSCYLASLAAGIKSSNLPVIMTFERLHGDQRRPVLILSSVEDGSENSFSKTRARIRLLPSISRNLFPTLKLSPSRCNIRSSPNTPTPLYNAAILTDSTYLHFLTQIYTSTQLCPALIDASLLGRIWLRQRGFTGSYCDGGFGAFEWTWFLSYLLQGGRPNGRNVLEPGFSSFQLFRGTLNALAMKDRIEDDHVECLDQESGVNVFHKMTPASYKLLQHEATGTLTMLSESPDDVFSSIFMTKVDNPILRYDIAARISVPVEENSAYLDSPTYSFSSIKRVASILEHGLTTRATISSVSASENTSHSISSSILQEPATLTLGILIDPESSRRLVDHGPPASDGPAALSFRSFWGDKAELRRFKDGSILESVVWTCKSVEERYGIVKRIVRYVLARHISAGVAGDIVFLTPSLYLQIAAPPEVRSIYLKTEGDGFQSLSEAFDGFVRHLNDLNDMPLAISSVVWVSEGSTQTSVYAPYPQNYARMAAQPAGSYHVPVHESVIQLEGSGKWPDDLRAIQKVKIGLLLFIARQLEETHPVSAKVGLENTDFDIGNIGFLDVAYDHGYTFRVRIQHDPNHREVQLIERHLKNKLLPQSDRTRYELSLNAYQDMFIRGAAHAQALHALRSKYFFLPHTIRLVKRWFAAHMLSQQISFRVIELIVCYVFVHPQPWTAPASAELGFLRTLRVLAIWDWRKDPMVVDLDGSMTCSRFEEIGKLFEGVRKQDPGIAHAAWSIYTPYDNIGSCWTKEKPGKAVATRVAALARSSLEVISKDSGNIKQIFTTPLTDYDFIIRLRVDYSMHSKSFKNLRDQTWKDVLVDFDPVREFLKELETCFGDAILWFYDANYGTVIAGLWNPHVVASRQWKITLNYSTIPAGELAQDNKLLVTLNKQSILNEISRLGGELISSVDVK